jgi:hypothetical protein
MPALSERLDGQSNHPEKYLWGIAAKLEMKGKFFLFFVYEKRVYFE